MGWKGTLYFTRDKVIDRLLDVCWEDLTNEQLENALEAIITGDHISIVDKEDDKDFKVNSYETY